MVVTIYIYAAAGIMPNVIPRLPIIMQRVGGDTQLITAKKRNYRHQML